MTECLLLAALIAAVLLMPGVASAADDNEMLRAFGDAVRTLPPAPVVKPQPRPKPAVKATTQPDHQAEAREQQQASTIANLTAFLAAARKAPVAATGTCRTEKRCGA